MNILLRIHMSYQLSMETISWERGTKSIPLDDSIYVSSRNITQARGTLFHFLFTNQ